MLTSFNEARMTPLTLPTQITLESRVTAGAGVSVWTYNDYWGTYVSVFDLPDAHDELAIRAVATVETEPFPGIAAAAERPTWTQLSDKAKRGRLFEFLLPTPLTTVTEEITSAAKAEISGLSPDDAAAAISARYVSGYLHPQAQAEPGSTAVGQSHAWVEYWAGSWTPLDPTSGAAVGERHVVVARGRDYVDVPPLKGIYHGPAGGDLQVTVEVTRLA